MAIALLCASVWASAAPSPGPSATARPPVPPPPMPAGFAGSPQAPVATPRPSWRSPEDLGGPAVELAGHATIAAVNVVAHPVLGPVSGKLVLRRPGKPEAMILERSGVVVEQLVAEDLDGAGRRELAVVWATTGTGHYITPEIYDISPAGKLTLRWSLPAGQTLADGVFTALPRKGFLTKEALVIHSFKRPYLHRTVLYSPTGGKFVAAKVTVGTPKGPHQTVNAAGDLFERHDYAGAGKLYADSVDGLARDGEPDLAAEALLGAARCAVKRHDREQAMQFLTRLAHDYPKTESGAQAPAALARLRAHKEDVDR